MRDLIGYGGETPTLVWPNGARVAVSIVVNFEEGAEQQVGDCDAESERIGEVLCVVEPGTRDIGQEQVFAYGIMQGFGVSSMRWRRTGSPQRSSAAVVPSSACRHWRPRSPARARACLPWLALAAAFGLTEPRQRRTTSIAASRYTEAATGGRPYGFFCRGSESSDAALLIERGFLYTSNAFDDDLPYFDRSVPGGPLLVLPYALDSNDMKFFHPNGFCERRNAELCRDAPDVLLPEAERGKSRLLNVGFHLRIAGRPGRFRAVEQILDMVQGLGSRAWVARRIDIARYALATMRAS